MAADTDATLAVLLHASDEPCDWYLPPGTWEVVVDTAAPGEEPATRVLSNGEPLAVVPRSLVVLRLMGSSP